MRAKIQMDWECSTTWSRSFLLSCPPSSILLLHVLPLDRDLEEYDHTYTGALRITYVQWKLRLPTIHCWLQTSSLMGLEKAWINNTCLKMPVCGILISSWSTFRQCHWWLHFWIVTYSFTVCRISSAWSSHWWVHTSRFSPYRNSWSWQLDPCNQSESVRWPCWRVKIQWSTQNSLRD